MDYAVGLMFNLERSKVLLIRKNKPEWQQGYLNGVGGKIESFDTSPLAAMIREFEEETSVFYEDWHHAFTIKNHDNDYNLTFFYAFSDKIFETKSVTEEKLEIIELRGFYNQKMIDNLYWIIPLCLSNTDDTHLEPFEINWHGGN